ncbi:TetR/AcrR family transcriptional regulator [Idiomarina xiamenensis]|uniref:TetR family transcriptional regulator n=1 Tax=Idiomarina xiamenensis 10-D-4 TaxID=740709 RepID=K2KCJ5_9GAMM|nr:TetR family transcriptional regulator C-terminal domain-containing protein [Idiomarina xiamenensis]EKE84382.1 TetR family transcriptional regulator [Idiomarina xiamenensis 10-D-4]
MPRKVDHQQRRLVIIKALLVFAAREGMHRVSLRQIASEAGISLRLVQYYFDSKADLMQAGLDYLEQRSHRLWSARIAQLPQPLSATDTLAAFVATALPLDQQSREFQLLWTSFAMLALTDETISNRAFVDGPTRLQEQLTAIIQSAIDNAEFSSNLHAEQEAQCLMALVHGLGAALLVGQQTASQAKANITAYLARLSA